MPGGLNAMGRYVGRRRKKLGAPPLRALDGCLS